MAKQQGFTLIELLIAMALSLGLVMATATVYSSLKQTSVSTERLASAQEALRTSYGLISRAVRQADTVTTGAELMVRYAEIKATDKVTGCLGQNKAVGIGAFDRFFLKDGKLYCNDGVNEEIIAMGISEFSTSSFNSHAINLRLGIDTAPENAKVLDFVIAMRQKVVVDNTKAK